MGRVTRVHSELRGKKPGDRVAAQPDLGRTSDPLALTRCPNCGEHRVGGFRFCRLCGLDFDLVEETSSTSPWLLSAAPPAAAPAPGRQLVSRERLMVLHPDRSIIAVGAGAYMISMRAMIAIAVAVGITAGVVVALVSIVLD